MNCPRCGSDLRPIQYDGVTVDVCSNCQGEWLLAGELQKIASHHDEVFTAQELALLEGVNKEIFTVEKDDHDELNCPACKNVPMERFNYGDTSGLMLHKCAQCDGIWMDKGELEKIEELTDGWKADLNEDSEKYGPILDKIEVQEQAELDKSVSISRFGFVNAVLRRFCES